MYFCGEHTRLWNVSRIYRKHAWSAWRRGRSGIIFWYASDYDKWDNIFDGGATAVHFAEYDSIFSSRRWEAWRDGIEDHQYFTMLKDLAQKAPAKEQQVALKLLTDNVAEVLEMDDKFGLNDKWKHAYPSGPGESAEEAQTYDDARERIAQAIIALQKNN